MGNHWRIWGEKTNNVIRLNLESFPPAADGEINWRTAREKWERPPERPSQESRRDEGGLARAWSMELLDASVWCRRAVSGINYWVQKEERGQNDSKCFGPEHLGEWCCHLSNGEWQGRKDFGDVGGGIWGCLHMSRLRCFGHSQVEVLRRQVDIRSQSSKGRLRLEMKGEKAQDPGKDLARTNALWGQWLRTR